MSIDFPIRLRKASYAYKIALVTDRLRHYAYLALGVLLTCVGAIAVILPVIPVVSTLLASTFFLTRSSPELQYRINGLPLVGRFFKYLDGSREMTSSTRAGFAIYLWGNLIVTCACLYGIGLASYPIVSINVFCCLLSTVYLLKFRAVAEKITQAIPAKQCSATTPIDDESQALRDVEELRQELTESQSDLRSSIVTTGLPFSSDSVDAIAK